MNVESAVLVLVILIGSSIGSADESIADRAQMSLSNEMYGEVAAKVERRLKDSGLSAPEVLERAEATSKGYARCLVDFLQSQPNTEYSEMLRLTAAGMNESEVRTELGAEFTKVDETVQAHKSEIEGCLLNVQQFLGIPGGLLFD